MVQTKLVDSQNDDFRVWVSELFKYTRGTEGLQRVKVEFDTNGKHPDESPQSSNITSPNHLTKFLAGADEH